MRDCANCKHYVVKDTRTNWGNQETTKIYGCELWDCNQEERNENDGGGTKTMVIVDRHIECSWCHKVHDRPRDLLRYDDKIFCDEKCLGEYLVDKADGDIETIDFDTPENIEMMAMERKAEY